MGAGGRIRGSRSAQGREQICGSARRHTQGWVSAPAATNHLASREADSTPGFTSSPEPRGLPLWPLSDSPPIIFDSPDNYLAVRRDSKLSTAKINTYTPIV